MKKGTQIAKIPLGGSVDDPEVEFGFVMSVNKLGAFCRYWNKDLSLRTLANSELTMMDNLVEYVSVPPYKVTLAIELIEGLNEY